MKKLGAADFAAYFTAVHEHEPFPWQQELASRVLDPARGWPDVLDLPTGSGKTSVIDIALFALAVNPAVAPRRTVLVVDRRVVVDQAAIAARKLMRSLDDPRDSVLRRVSTNLRSLWPSPGGAMPKDPFVVSVLRGAMPKDASWARRPDAPLIALSTVDQLGSRLLFRGYGVSPRSASIHAGLFGQDTLVLLDEVHLSTAFAETLLALRDRWRRVPEGGADRWSFVRMSATPLPGATKKGRFSLTPADRKHPVLRRRLEAHKSAALREVKVSGNENTRRATFAAALVATATERLEAGTQRLAVVVNRVDSARRVTALLSQTQCELVMLTGRMRPLDRDRLLGDADDPTSLLARLMGNGTETGRPLVVVATQCIEAGADFDFDGLVTECASLDALRQRFGRVDRRGRAGTTNAAILVRSDALEADDPVYGTALASTWTLLQSMVKSGVVDFGISSFQVPADCDPYVPPQVQAPVLLPAHLDAWAQTSQTPEPLPEVGDWLHGPSRSVPEVRLVWRADLPTWLADRRTPSTSEVDELSAAIAAVRPSTLEALSVPLWAGRRWLAAPVDPLLGADADVEAMAEPTDEVTGESESARWALRWNGTGVVVVDDPADIAPGETILIPASYGGIAGDNWDPNSTAAVIDLGDFAQHQHWARPTLRLHPAVLAQYAPEGADLAAVLPRLPNAEDERSSKEIDAEIDAALGTLIGLAPAAATLVEHLRRASVRRRVAGPGGWTLVRRRRLRFDEQGEVSTEDDDASFLDAQITLAKHSSDVRAWCETFATNLGLPPAVHGDLCLAGWLHDIGKADPRFQQMLLGGSDVALAMQTDLLAKSGGSALDRRARARAQARSGYPKGCRHEILSVAMIDATHGAVDAASDPDLVRHLVGSHHGWCRPFAPAIDDSKAIEVEFRHGERDFRGSVDHSLARLDSGVSERYWSLTERYGWWGLAWLEAILRLADHRASEASQELVEGSPS